MLDIQVFIGPLVGAIIGLITNGIAIRMLFRPLHPVKIFGFTLPFTPGIIPKEKARIARSCGDVVGKLLVNEEVLKRGLISEEMDHKISGFIENGVETYKNSDITVREMLNHVVNEEKTAAMIDGTKTSVTSTLYRKACHMDIGFYLADAAMEEIKNNSLFNAVSMFITEDMLGGIHKKIEDTVENMILERGEEVIGTTIDRETEHILDLSMEELYERFGSSVPRITHFLLEVYHRLVEDNLSRVLQTINIATLVEDQINRFDVAELEKIILDIMKKELNAIIWLGGLLGCIMGFIMNLV